MSENLKQQLMNEALKRGKITPCRFKTWDECFEIIRIPERNLNIAVLWFNQEFRKGDTPTTGMVTIHL